MSNSATPSAAAAKMYRGIRGSLALPFSALLRRTPTLRVSSDILEAHTIPMIRRNTRFLQVQMVSKHGSQVPETEVGTEPEVRAWVRTGV